MVQSTSSPVNLCNAFMTRGIRAIMDLSLQKPSVNVISATTYVKRWIFLSVGTPDQWVFSGNIKMVTWK